MLNYKLRDNYEPHTGLLRQPVSFDDLLLGEDSKLRAPRAGFEQHQTGTVPSETLYQRVHDRLSSSRAVVRHRGTVNALEASLGVSPEMAASLSTTTRVGRFRPAQAVSRAQVDALLSTGLPHMKNVAVAGFLSLGEKGWRAQRSS